MSFSIYKSIVALCDNERIILYNLNTNEENIILLPSLEDTKKNDIHNNTDIDAFHMITTVIFSNDGKYFVVCTNRKQLCLYESKTQKLVSNRTLTRAASRVRFSPNNDIIVADKTGDVYIYSTSAPMENGLLILGHLSMLLDVLITEDQQHILTTDRDEKIRVSLFPNSYNILSYCLGHTKFVTNISELPHNKHILVSVGGDGMFIFWDYKSGIDILSIDFSDKIPKHNIDKFNERLRDCHLEESVEILPVKHLKVSALDKATSLLIATFYCSKILLVYSISGSVKSNLTADYMQLLNISDEPIECCLVEHNLWILTNSGFEVYKFVNNNFVTNHIIDPQLEHLNNCWTSLKRSTVKQDLFSILYKRKYDNVQEYLERKRQRLESSSD